MRKIEFKANVFGAAYVAIEETIEREKQLIQTATNDIVAAAAKTRIELLQQALETMYA